MQLSFSPKNIFIKLFVVYLMVAIIIDLQYGGMLAIPVAIAVSVVNLIALLPIYFIIKKFKVWLKVSHIKLFDIYKLPICLWLMGGSICLLGDMLQPIADSDIYYSAIWLAITTVSMLLWLPIAICTIVFKKYISSVTQPSDLITPQENFSPASDPSPQLTTTDNIVAGPATFYNKQVDTIYSVATESQHTPVIEAKIFPEPEPEPIVEERAAPSIGSILLMGEERIEFLD